MKNLLKLQRQWLLAIFAKALSGMRDWVLNVFEIYFFYLFLSIIHVLLYLFNHLLFYLSTSVYVSRVYILDASCYYSHVLACFIIFVVSPEYLIHAYDIFVLV